MIIDFFSSEAGERAGARRRRETLRSGAGRGVSQDYLEFGFDYFDNPRHGVGYGGYHYDGRYAVAAEAMCEHYGLRPGARVLEVGCAKGFVLVEFFKRGMVVAGIDASEYAVSQAHPQVREWVRTGSVLHLPFEDGTFDLVFGKEVLPHVPEADVETAVAECMRVSRQAVFFEIQCGRTETELSDIRAWDPTHAAIRSPTWWDALFRKIGYDGDVHYKALFRDDAS